MKKKLFNVALVLMPFLGFAQMGGSVVFDPTQASNMSTQISNTTQQINQLEKSLEYMKKAQETLNKVNGYVRDVSSITEITGMYKQAVSIASRVRTDAQRIKNPNTKKRVLTNVSQLLNSLSNGVSFVNKILTNDFFKMTDKERLDLLNTERRKIFIKKSQLSAYL